MTTNLMAMSAVELAQLFEEGDASPVEVAQATLDQIERHNGTLNCVCLVDPDTTLEMARASEARWHNGAPNSAIDGVPVTIKDVPADQTPVEAYGDGRPVDMMDTLSGLPTYPQAQ